MLLILVSTTPLHNSKAPSLYSYILKEPLQAFKTLQKSACGSLLQLSNQREKMLTNTQSQNQKGMILTRPDLQTILTCRGQPPLVDFVEISQIEIEKEEKKLPFSGPTLRFQLNSKISTLLERFRSYHQAPNRMLGPSEHYVRTQLIQLRRLYPLLAAGQHQKNGHLEARKRQASQVLFYIITYVLKVVKE